MIPQWIFAYGVDGELVGWVYSGHRCRMSASTAFAFDAFLSSPPVTAPGGVTYTPVRIGYFVRVYLK
jgi:hypothetical protein